MRRPTWLVALGVVVALVAVGCGGSAKDATSAGTTVAGASAATAITTPHDARLAAAVKAYDQYVIDQTDQLLAGTKELCAALQTGDLAAAQAAYPKARVHYERIEIVAEAWGELDEAIDGRSDEFATSTTPDTGGFHRIEALLWADHTLAGVAGVCSALVDDVAQLDTIVRSNEYTPAELANGSTALLDEIERTKVTGEEERYSHTDLVDFQANLEGAMEAMDLFGPFLQAERPQLWADIAQHKAALDAVLAGYHAAPGVAQSGWVDYASVDAAGRRQLAQTVDALAETVSQTAKVVDG